MRTSATIGKAIRWVVVAICAVACFAVLQCVHRYHFCYQEQTQLFLNSVDYAATYFSDPAWLACLVGDYLTQFYYFTYAGPAILSVLLVGLWLIVWGGLRRAGLNAWVGFAAGLVLASIVLCLCFNERYRLPSVVALVGGAAAFCALPRRGATWVRVLSAVLVGGVAWWCFGNGVLLLGALCAVETGVKKGETWREVVGVAVVLALVPTAAGAYTRSVVDLYALPGLGEFRSPSKAIDMDLGVITEYGLGNKNRVISMVEGAERPSQIMKFYYNLVMAERGLLADNLLKWPDNNLGTFNEIAPETPTLVTYSLNDLYWVLGDMTHTERAAMLANVFAPKNRNIKMTKRLAEVSLVTADVAAANKYLRLLSQTVEYGKWADALLQGEPNAMRTYTEKARLINLKDTITTGQNSHVIMMQLADSNPRNTVAVDYALCSLLLLQDMENFKRDYDRFCMANGMPRPKKLYQEALCIYLAGKDAPREDWQRYITDADVMDRFVQYNHQRGSAQFKDTYWYYFDRQNAMKRAAKEKGGNR